MNKIELSNGYAINVEPGGDISNLTSIQPDIVQIDSIIEQLTIDNLKKITCSQGKDAVTSVFINMKPILPFSITPREEEPGYIFNFGFASRDELELRLDTLEETQAEQDEVLDYLLSEEE